MRNRLIAVVVAAVALAALLRQGVQVLRAPALPPTAAVAPESGFDIRTTAASDDAAGKARAALARSAQPIVAAPGKGLVLRDGPVGARFTADGLSLGAVTKAGTSGWTLNWSVEGARAVTPAPEGELATRINSLIGDAGQWTVNQPAWSRLRYAGIQDGVDLVFESRPHGVEYSFEIAAGARPADLRLRVDGATAVQVSDIGDAIEFRTGLGVVKESGLLAYQTVDGARVPVAARYRSTGPGSYGIELGAYDTSRPLVVDPTINWTAYVGGTFSSDPWYAHDSGNAIAVDSFGDVYIAGTTDAQDIATAGAYQKKASDINANSYVAKLRGDGTGIIWATYLASANPSGLALDAARNVYMTGWTSVKNFPIVGGFQTTALGTEVSVVAKLAADGASLVWSSYLGGSYIDHANAIAVDGSNNVYLAGETYSGDFPIPSGLDNGFDFNGNVFVTKIAAAGSSILWTARLGGAGYDSARGIALDASNNVFVTGVAQSTTYPVTTGAYNVVHNSGSDAFVTKIKNTGTALVFSTYLGGTGDDYGAAIKVDSGGNAVVGGYTSSYDFPTKLGFQMTSHGSFDSFVTKLNAAGTKLTWSSYLGGDGVDLIAGLALDSANNVYVSGWTTSTSNFPLTGAFRSSSFSLDGGFVTKIKPGGAAIAWSSYTGGFMHDAATAIAVDAAGNAYVLGTTDSASGIATANGFDQVLGGATDAYVLKVATGGALTWGTYYGGQYVNGYDYVTAAALDGSANVYMTGPTSSVDFPPTAGAFDKTFGNVAPGRTTYDVFVTKVMKTGSLVWTTYLGGDGDDQGKAIKVDNLGNVYVTGTTGSLDFPVTAGSLRTVGDGQDIFVSKLNPAGSSLLWSTYFGGYGGFDTPYAIALDSSKNVVIAGNTTSGDFPISGAFDSTFSGSSDAFISKIAANGKALNWSTYLGGIGSDTATALALDSNNNVYVGGWTSSPDFPTTGGFQKTFGGGSQDGFVAKLNAMGRILSFGSFLGGSGDEVVNGLALTSSNDIYVVGWTASYDFPVTTGAFKGAFGGGASDGFVTKVKPAGSALAWSTYLGGSGSDQVMAVAVDSASNPIVTGTTTSTNFPLTAGAFRTTLGGYSDAFVTKLALAGTSLTWSTLLGGDGEDEGRAIGLDTAGHVYVAGMTRSTDIGTSAAFDSSLGGDFDGFVTRIDQ